MKSKQIFKLATLAMIIIIGSCQKDDYKPIDSLCPMVISTNPPNNATGVPINQIVTATFNEAMDPKTITETSFTLHGSLIPGTVTYSDSTAVFTPTDPLIPNHTYTGRIATTVKDMMGNALQEEYVWTFNTDTLVTPLVIATDPKSNETNVALSKNILATFNMPMDAATLTSASFVVKQGTTPVAGVITYNGVTATFNPTANFTLGLIYTATITTDAKNLAGTPLTNDYVWTFSTGALVAPIVISTDPANNAVGVSLGKTIAATFSMPMLASTLNTTTFTLQQGSTNIAGIVAYAGTTATFKPTANLLPGLVYTATITTGATSTGGTALANNYVWTFTTAVLTPPLVISTDPADNATLVAINKTLTATFNMPMDPATINSATFTLKYGNVTKVGTVSYSGVIATFNPTTDLLPNTVYTATITAGAKNAAGTNLASNYVWTFTTAPAAPNAPLVLSTDPTNNATNVALNKSVTATFNMPMDPATINTATFTVKQGTTVIAGTISYTGNVATFNPTLDFLPGLLYTATITTGATSAGGTALATNYVWTFTSLPAPTPVITSTDPANNATNVALNKTVTATFNMVMNGATINATTFTVMQGTTPVVGVVSYAGTVASFNPTIDFLPGLVYTATITTGATSGGGTALANNYVWSFTTISAAPIVTSTDPANNATNVALNKSATATFNMVMNGATINGTTFTIMQGATPVVGVVSYAGTVATFNPTLDFLPGLVYTATITTGATSAGGTALANNYVWSFTTLAATPPLVISTDPMNNATGVALNKTITATFNMAMNPATINNLTFTLQEGANTIVGLVTYTGNTASFDPTSNLISGKTYTATITTGAQNVGGTGLANNYVWTFSTTAPTGPLAPNLNSAADFGILAATTVTNNAGLSQIINMNVGVYPGTAVSGFPPGIVVNGVIMTAASPAPAPATLLAAKNDLTAAYLYAEGASSPAPVTVAGNIGGTTLAPGIYKSTSTLSVDGTSLTLDAGGDPNAVWIFQIGSTLITTTGGSIILAGGAQSKNIYWQVGSSATVGDNTAFHGNILALVSITMNTNATAVGRMLTQTGAVVLTSTNIITKP